MKTTLQSFWLDFDQAWNRHEAEAVAALFEDNAIFTFIDGRIFTGRRQVREFYRDAFSTLETQATHQANVDVEAGPSGRGSFRISSPKRMLLLGNYEIELSPQRLIARLILKQ